MKPTATNMLRSKGRWKKQYIKPISVHNLSTAELLGIHGRGVKQRKLSVKKAAEWFVSTDFSYVQQRCIKYVTGFELRIFRKGNLNSASPRPIRPEPYKVQNNLMAVDHNHFPRTIWIWNGLPHSMMSKTQTWSSVLSLDLRTVYENKSVFTVHRYTCTCSLHSHFKHYRILSYLWT